MQSEEPLSTPQLEQPIMTPIFNDEIMCMNDITNTFNQTNFDILLVKHLHNGEITDEELQQLEQKQRDMLVSILNKNKNKKKRPDESQKLFYKRAFKYSENKFFKKRKNKSRRKSEYYHYHFETISVEMRTPITQFYHPNKKTKPGLSIGHKTFNAKYVKLLLRSPTFKKDVTEYHSIFVKDCIEERQRKLKSFTESLKRIIQRSYENSQQILKYLQSSQCKIPWTDEEIQQAWKLARKDIGQEQECVKNITNETDEQWHKMFQFMSGRKEDEQQIEIEKL